MAKLRIHSGADDDFLEGYLWYSKHSRRSAEQFDEQVQAAFQRIAADPLAGTAYDASYRFCSLPNFPHLVIYRFENEVVTVVAIHHPSRDPGYWLNR